MNSPLLEFLIRIGVAVVILVMPFTLIFGTAYIYAKVKDWQEERARKRRRQTERSRRAAHR